MHRNHVKLLLLMLLAAHLLLGLGRVPHAVFGKRNVEAELYQRVGPVRYHLDTKYHKGADAVEWLLKNTPADSVILWKGKPNGSLELVADLVFPRVLYEAWRVPEETRSLHGRPIAVQVLVGFGSDIALVPR